MVQAYKDYAWHRDIGFVQSLNARGRNVYSSAIRTIVERDKRTVYECFLEPPSPPLASSKEKVADARTLAIVRAQKRWRERATDLPAYFDAADAAFARMAQARDSMLAGGK
jgi:hypothetical protein